MPSRKVVFFVPPDAEACHFLKELLQDKYGMPSGTDEGLVFDYISHKVNATSMELKLYLVPDLEKYKKIRPLYFTNVHTFVVVYDVGKCSLATWEKICQDLKLHQSNSNMAFLGYKKGDEDINAEISDFIRSHKGISLQFSGRDGRGPKFVFQYLLEYLIKPNAQIT